MAPLTIGLLGIAAFLGAANIIVSLFPKKTSVNVAFIPPSPSAISIPHSGVETNKLEAHIQSTNQKITSLFSRVEAIEKSVQSLMGRDAPVKDNTWLQTVPVRGRKSK